MVHLDPRTKHLLPRRAVCPPGGPFFLGHPQEDDWANEEAQDKEAHDWDQDDNDEVGVVAASCKL